MNKPITYISLFSSAGIGCFGFKQNKFECIATNEILEKRLKIQRFNDKCSFDSGYVSGDITDDRTKEALIGEIDKWKEKYHINELDVLVATPPCQGMSVANHKKNQELKRNSLVVESIKITRQIKPKFFIFENVRSFLNTICTDVDGENKKIGRAIESNLGGIYNIFPKTINFKDYGSNSSRTRTLVIGVRKDLSDITPYHLMPSLKTPKTTKKLIGDLPSLTTMGEILVNDIYHSYRGFDKRMLSWIEGIKEGQSAFDNEDILCVPHRIIDGEMIFNQNKNGDKYSRWYWNQVAPCVHTRNDILASQNTIHPADNRVFSIRELMRMMTIPETFKWSDTEIQTLNAMSLSEKKTFLKKEELNIRHCIGEAVPTAIFFQIALKIKKYLKAPKHSMAEIKKIVLEKNLADKSNLWNYLKANIKKERIEYLFNISELANSNRQETAAYFTKQDICYSVVKSLPDFKNKKTIRILEPSVGVGNFIPLIVEKYRDIGKVKLDIIDIDNQSLDILRLLLSQIDIPENFEINFINDDFLLWENSARYDLVVGNPPYGKLTSNKLLLKKYKADLYNSKTSNQFSFFIEKAIRISDYISLIVPKSITNAPEFNLTRELLLKQDLIKICDYGEKGFKGVKIETISFLLNTKFARKTDVVKIESYITENIVERNKEYTFSKEYPYWLIYRNDEFDSIANKMNFNIFNSFRDRQITKTITRKKGKIRVIKSRNVKSLGVETIDNYDCYIDDVSGLAVAKYLNSKGVVMVPNLTYKPRAAFLPEKSIVDGSVALLTLKNGTRKPRKKDLEYYGTEEFERFYRIARNNGTRSLNIDNNAVFFFGLLKGE